MKRTKRASEPRTNESLQPLAADELARVKGGATAIEYGLLLALPPNKP
ncbi:MAG TPA: Flp family type IVb pilin [Kofleriaceae bacterium]|nr:Flp family type IVb pilin [Kofleriaceae bacterium]